MLFFVLVLATLAVAFATHGVDVSQLTSQSSFSCLKSNGYNFAIIRVYQSNGVPDKNGPSSINNAWNGGMAHVDGYIFPCYSCGNPAKQIDDTINSLKSSGITFASKEERALAAASNTTLGATYGMLWIDVEGSQVRSCPFPSIMLADPSSV